MNDRNKHLVINKDGFSLIEVVLAIGIFLVTVLALVGLLGPTLQSVNEVEKTDEVSSIVNTLNAFLQNSPDIAHTSSKFDSIYNAVSAGGEATVYVYRWYEDSDDVAVNPIIKLEVGFAAAEDDYVGKDSIVNAPPSTGEAADFSKAAGTIYRAVLTLSSVNPLIYHHATTTDSDGQVTPQRDSGTETYKLADAYSVVSAFNEGSFAMEVRIFDESPPGPNSTGAYPITDLTALKDLEPIFTYNTAVVR